MRVPRVLATLSAISLSLGGATTALAAASEPQPLVPASAAVAAPSTWPAVPVAERLQPWLAGELAKGGQAPLRVMISGESTAAAAAAAERAGLTVQQTWQQVGIVVALGTPDAIRSVVPMSGVTFVEGDEPLEYELDTAHTATRSDQALTAVTASGGERLDGRGVTIAVIDSGIDGTHPMFTRDGDSKVVRNLENVCTIANGPGDVCFLQEPTNDTDTNSGGGHGTHVAGIAAGYEVTTTDGVALRGAAPEAKLVGLSVGAAIGLINANAAMNWVVEHQRKPCAASGAAQEGDLDPACPPIRATNHSYGPINTTGEDNTFSESSATVRIQRSLIAKGVAPVWAAGNDGGDGSVALTNPPGMDPTPGVLMVASYNDGQNGSRDNALSGFSSRGKQGVTGSYPDISAPGDLITSACRPTLAVCQGAPSYDEGDYQTISGTSMATPYIAGVVAQLVQADGAQAPGVIENLLEDTAHKFAAGAPYEADPLNPDNTTSFDKGHGLVDVTAALATARGVPVPAPVAAASSCQPDARFADAAGDANNALGLQTPLPSDPALDIRLVSVQDIASPTVGIRFSARVEDLTPPAEYGQYFEFEFVGKGERQFLIAQRPVSGAQTFTYGDYRGTSGGRRTLATVTGSFDDVKDEVSITLPLGTAQPKLAQGDQLSALKLTTRRIVAATVPDADTAAGGCLFTIGAQVSAPEPEPSGTASPTEELPVEPTEPAAPATSASPTTPAAEQSPAGGDTSPTPGATTTQRPPATGGGGGGGTAPAHPSASASAVNAASTPPSAAATASTSPTGTTAASAEGRLVTLSTPTRVLDSRTGTGTTRGTKSGDVVLDLAGRVPEGATAAVLNVTVTNPAGNGHLVAFPAGSPMPPTSNVNFRRAQTQANEVVVRVPADRRLVLHVAGTSAHVVADLLGWSISTTSSDSGFVTALASPQRLLDTRTTSQPRRRGELPVAVGEAVPTSATAVILNVTVTGPDARGFAVAYPTGAQRPGTSNVNVERGQTQANEVLVGIGRDRSVSIFLDSMSAAVVVDLVGYISPDAAQARAFVPLPAPERLADTREGRGMGAGRKSGSSTLSLPASVPADATSVLLNVTATGASRSGFVTVFPTGSRLPETSNVNFSTGTTQANEVLVRVGQDRAVTLHVGGSGTPASHLVVDVVGYVRPS